MNPSFNTIRQMILSEPGLSYPEKDRLLRELDMAQADMGQQIDIDKLTRMGLGGLSSYIAAKHFGAGPILSGIAAVLGATLGDKLLKPRPSGWGSPYTYPVDES